MTFFLLSLSCVFLVKETIGSASCISVMNSTSLMISDKLFIYSSSQIMIILKHIKAIVKIKLIHTYKPFSTAAQSKWQIWALTSATVTIILVWDFMWRLILFSWNAFLLLISVLSKVGSEDSILIGVCQNDLPLLNIHRLVKIKLL